MDQALLLAVASAACVIAAVWLSSRANRRSREAERRLDVLEKAIDAVRASLAEVPRRVAFEERMIQEMEKERQRPKDGA